MSLGDRGAMGDSVAQFPMGGGAMFELKFLSQEGIPGALAKAERYRLLNQPWEAECIYRDVLQVDAVNQEAVIGLVLALTDQFERGSAAIVSRAREALVALRDAYQHA